MEFIIYAAVYRLAVIAAGVACAYMGYRLFMAGVMPREGSDIDAAAGEIRLTLKNAAPGTCFAAFGSIIIATMIWQGNPEFSSTKQGPDGAQSSTTMRGGDDASLPQIQRGLAMEQQGRLGEAIEAYATALTEPSQTLAEASAPLFRLAAVYHRQRRYGEALAFASLAAQVGKDRDQALALVADIERARESELKEATQ